MGLTFLTLFYKSSVIVLKRSKRKTQLHCVNWRQNQKQIVTQETVSIEAILKSCNEVKEQ